MIGLQVVFSSIDFSRSLTLVAAAGGGASAMQTFMLLGGAAVVIGGVCGGLAFYTRWAHKQKTDSHPGLFSELCKAHELDRKQSGLLKQVIKIFRMTQPAQIFAQPKWLASNQLAAKMPTRKEDLKDLRDILFGKKPKKAVA